MRPGEPPTEESSEKLFYDLFFARIESSADELEFYSNNSKEDKAIILNKEIVEQEGVWLLKTEKEWSLVTVGTLARKFHANFWVKNSDISKLKSEKYDLSSVGRVKLNSRIGSQAEEYYGELNREDILSVIDIIVNLKDGRRI